MKIIVPVLILFLLSCGVRAEPDIQHGDIIFQISRSSQSRAIQIATGSQYSHMGLVTRFNGVNYVYEAVQPVKLTRLDLWIKRGVKEHCVIKRLKNASEVLTPENLAKMQKEALKFDGKDYDIYFGWSDERVYCSELVWKIYKRALGIEIGRPKKLKDFNLNNPDGRKKLEERYGKKIPLNETVISPGDMFDSPLLRTVYSY